jgi:hypothetical protein
LRVIFALATDTHVILKRQPLLAQVSVEPLHVAVDLVFNQRFRMAIVALSTNLSSTQRHNSILPFGVLLQIFTHTHPQFEQSAVFFFFGHTGGSSSFRVGGHGLIFLDRDLKLAFACVPRPIPLCRQDRSLQFGFHPHLRRQALFESGAGSSLSPSSTALCSWINSCHLNHDRDGVHHLLRAHAHVRHDRDHALQRSAALSPFSSTIACISTFRRFPRHRLMAFFDNRLFFLGARGLVDLIVLSTARKIPVVSF